MHADASSHMTPDQRDAFYRPDRTRQRPSESRELLHLRAEWAAVASAPIGLGNRLRGLAYVLRRAAWSRRQLFDDAYRRLGRGMTV
jgi:hypothetical protein